MTESERMFIDACVFSIAASLEIPTCEVMEDFKNFSKAVDELMAKGMTEDEACNSLRSTWVPAYLAEEV